jgi:ERCC4-type nuclease
MEILIDNREKGRKQQALEYYNNKNHTAKITQLEYGDYLFNNTIIFEFKTITDMLNSIDNSSVFNEVANQTTHYTYSYLIICGNLTKTLQNNYQTIPQIRRKNPNPQKYYKRNITKYMGAIRRIRTMCPIIEVNTLNQAFNEMLLQSEKAITTKNYAGISRPILSTNPVDYLMGGANNIGGNKSRNIRETLNVTNLNELLSVNVEDFKRVSGIGDKTACKLYDWIHMKVED